MSNVAQVEGDRDMTGVMKRVLVYSNSFEKTKTLLGYLLFFRYGKDSLTIANERLLNLASPSHKQVEGSKRLFKVRERYDEMDVPVSRCIFLTDSFINFHTVRNFPCIFQLFGGLAIQEIQNQIDSKHDLLYVPAAENLGDLGTSFPKILQVT